MTDDLEQRAKVAASSGASKQGAGKQDASNPRSGASADKRRTAEAMLLKHLSKPGHMHIQPCR